MILKQVVQGPNFGKDWKKKNYSRSGLYAEGRAVGWKLGIPAPLPAVPERRHAALCGRWMCKPLLALGCVSLWSLQLRERSYIGTLEHLGSIY